MLAGFLWRTSGRAPVSTYWSLNQWGQERITVYKGVTECQAPLCDLSLGVDCLRDLEILLEGLPKNDGHGLLNVCCALV